MESSEEKNVTRKKKRRIKRISYSIVWLLLIVFIIFYQSITSIFTPHHIAYSNYINHTNLIIAVLLAVILFVIFKKIKVPILWVIGFLIFPIVRIIMLPVAGFKLIINIYRIISSIKRFATTFTYKILYFILFVFAAYLVLSNNNKLYIYSAMLVLLILLILHYFKKFCTITHSGNLFNKVEPLFFKFWDLYKKDSLNKNIEDWENTDPSDKKYSEKRSEILGPIWFFNRLFRRISEYLRSYKSNQIITAYFLIGIVFTLSLTIIIFSLEYYALGKISPNCFSINNLTFGNSIYFSLTIITLMDIAEIIPISNMAKFLVSLEIICSIIIIIILFFIFTTVTVERYKRDLPELAAKFEDGEAETLNTIKYKLKANLNEEVKDIIASLYKDVEDKPEMKWLELDENESIGSEEN